MQKPHRIIRQTTKNVGDPCSKYGYDRTGEQFEADIKAKYERGEFLWNEFIAFMKAHNVTPSELRTMFTKYYEEFL